jgi:hypothetical protein
MKGYHYYDNNLYAEKEDGTMYVLGLNYNSDDRFTGTTGHISVNPIESDLARQVKENGWHSLNFPGM